MRRDSSDAQFGRKLTRALALGQSVFAPPRLLFERFAICGPRAARPTMPDKGVDSHDVSPDPSRGLAAQHPPPLFHMLRADRDAPAARRPRPRPEPGKFLRQRLDPRRLRARL